MTPIVFSAFTVLIDTWWNVNTTTRIITAMTTSVLIDTWWNVNTGICDRHIIGIIRFNRYMVECE